MPTVHFYLKDELYAKAIYVQEQINKGLTLTNQKGLSTIFKEWVEARLNLEDIKGQIDVLTEEG